MAIRPRPYARKITPRASVTPTNSRELANIIASTADGRDITRPFVHGLQQPRDPRLLRSVDWGVYDVILEDDQVFSTLQQRRNAVVSRNWDVVPGDDDDPRSVAAAEDLKDNLLRIGWDRITDKMLYAVFYGYSVGELLWGVPEFDFANIHIRHARRFRYDDEGRLRLLTRANIVGEIMPERKFWVVTSGASDDDEPYGRGLAEWLYWPTLFKRNGMRFWNNFLDKFGSPTALGKYRPGTAASEIDNLLAAMQAIATDAGIAIPEGMAIELLQVAKSGVADYEMLCRYMDEAIAKIVLSQTMTTQDGSSNSQAQVHAGVKLEVVKSDADLLSDSFNAGPARWFTDWRYGTDVASPRVMRDVEEEIDTRNQAETDKIHLENGWERTDESFRDTYGDGYVRTAAKSPETRIGHNGGPAINDNEADNQDEEKRKAASFAEYAQTAEDDVLVDQLIAADGFRMARAMTGSLFDRIAGASTADDLQAILDTEAAELMDDGPLRESLERAQFALRLAEENREPSL